MNEPIPLAVLHVVQPIDGGAPAVAKQLITHDRDAGRRVALAAPRALAPWAAAAGVPFHPVEMERRPGAGDLRHILALRAIFAEQDLVVLHSTKAMADGRLALRTMARAKRPRAFSIPHSWSWSVGGRLEVAYRGFERVARDWTDLYVCVSEAEAAQGREVLGPIPVSILRNGVDSERFSPDGEVAERSDRPRVLCVGRLCEQKGQDLLVEAMVEVEGVELVLIGDGPWRRRIEGQIREAGIVDRCLLLGSTEPGPWLRSADLVALPSRWEGLSLVLLEAMSCGLPVVASPPAAADFGEEDGVVICPAEPAQLAATIRSLLDDEGRRTALGLQARRRVVADVSIERRDAEWDRLVEAVSGTQG